MLRFLLAAVLALVAGCVQIPPSPREIEAKKFESVPDKAVIYIVRPYPDINREHGFLSLDDSIPLTLFEGNFYRWEVAPGLRRIAGSGIDMSRITINAQSGRLYFVQHSVVGFGRSPTGGFLQLLSEEAGRAMVLRSTLIGDG